MSNKKALRNASVFIVKDSRSITAFYPGKGKTGHERASIFCRMKRALNKKRR